MISLEITEGKARIRVCEGVFYNPHMKMNRDITVAALRVLGARDYLDAFTATGIRGIRVALEAGVESILNDKNPRAVKCAEENVRRNNLSCEVLGRDAASLMHERSFDSIDLDPFGSPAPFMIAASKSAKKLLFVTSTDTSALCGSHPEAGLRKYGVHLFKTEYYPEVGLRALLGFSARCLAVFEKYAKPLMTYASRHYYRAILLIGRGARRSDEMLRKTGWILHCPSCLFRKIESLPSSELCPECGEKMKLMGPLWTGETKDRSFLEKLLEELEGEARELTERLLEELDSPMCYDHHAFCRMKKKSASKMEDFLERIREMGYEASRVHFSGTGFKTDAPFRLITSLI
ncbi:MAG: tRNA (guanine26-N2/guanine27-N2)-dimethyltransferase [Archaeoglobi archaeon]|nr:tRNA (guanine(10)-N(2))-dimethyltransferase [Candidatus Mnemosynella bozhongmuii]MDI3502583.1 tRNA (guanine26-N2/guanine27-N2)-dimethyltransferase [Archaeoglobi archaeon]MDK2782314.1 tRNA (guanine26-N2/guanine27-N2)-dimethyltransferase [Archaeoglobi archaeon]